MWTEGHQTYWAAEGMDGRKAGLGHRYISPFDIVTQHSNLQNSYQRTMQLSLQECQEGSRQALCFVLGCVYSCPGLSDLPKGEGREQLAVTRPHVSATLPLWNSQHSSLGNCHKLMASFLSLPGQRQRKDMTVCTLPRHS